MRRLASVLRGQGGTFAVRAAAGGRGRSQSRTRVPTPSARGWSRGSDPGFLMCPWRISLLHHPSPPENTGQGQERHLSSIAKVKPDLMT